MNLRFYKIKFLIFWLKNMTDGEIYGRKRNTHTRT